MAELAASANLRGGRIDLAFEVDTRAAAMPQLSLVRRRQRFPDRPGDGLAILDTAAYLRSAGGLWPRTRRLRFVAGNSPFEGGLVRLEVLLHYGAGSDLAAEVRVRGPDPNAPEEIAAGLARAELEGDEGGGSLRLFDDAGDRGELSWTSRALTWRGRLFRIEDAAFHRLLDDTTEVTESRVDGVTERRIATSRAGVWGLLLDARIREHRDRDRERWVRRFEIADRAPADPGGDEIAAGAYYYRVFGFFVGDSPNDRAAWSTAARATGRYGFGADPTAPRDRQHRLYNLLPAIMRRLDEPRARDRGTGQLRSFASIFGAGLDQLRSLAEDLGRRHDLAGADLARLPSLARYVGWPLDRTRDAITQRLDIASATDVYGSVGTLANVAALINRATGRDVAAKEFVHNVAFTNAIEPRRRWEIVTSRRAARAAWPEPGPALEATEGFHGRPALCTAGGETFAAWHAHDGDGWRLRLTKLGATGPVVRLGDGEVEPALVALPGTSDLLLISVRRYSTTRSDLVLRRITSSLAVAGAATLLTDHHGLDRWPAAAFDGERVRVFWQSNRSGIEAIWQMTLDPADPTAVMDLERFSPEGVRDEMPACASIEIGGGRGVRVVWSRDRGSASNLRARCLFGGRWGDPVWVTEGPHRDRAPALALGRRASALVFQSDRPDARGVSRQRLWQTQALGTRPVPPSIVADSHTAEAEPALAVADDGAVTLAWRSQRRATAAYTRTIDTADPGLLAAMGTEDDRAHYTWDAGDPAEGYDNGDWYAGHTVGWFFAASDADAPTVAREIERMKTFVEPFRPAHVRYVWHMPRRTLTPEPMRGVADTHRGETMTWLHTFDADHTEDRTLDTTSDPLDLSRRIFDRDVHEMAYG